MTIDVLFADVRGEGNGLIQRMRRRLFLWTSTLASLAMLLRNRFSTESLTGEPTAPEVSLTSYGRRILTVARTVESIGRGRQKPSRIVLWLDDSATFARLPANLLRARSRGLEIRLTDNLGPHTKYYPLVTEDRTRPLGPFATADDDIIYPRWWLERLSRAASETPEHVVAYRAHRIRMSNGHIDPYDEWNSVRSTAPHPTVFATGVSGVLYPTAMVRALRKVERGFVTTCPSSDDVWLHHVALTNGIPVRQVAPRPMHFWIVPDSQEGRLMDRNLEGGGNDAAVAALYGAAELAKLRSGGQV